MPLPESYDFSFTGDELNLIGKALIHDREKEFQLYTKLQIGAISQQKAESERQRTIAEDLRRAAEQDATRSVETPPPPPEPASTEPSEEEVSPAQA